MLLPKLSEITAASVQVVSIIFAALCHIVLLIEFPLAGCITDQATHSQQDVGLANEQGGWDGQLCLL